MSPRRSHGQLARTSAILGVLLAAAPASRGETLPDRPGSPAPRCPPRPEACECRSRPEVTLGQSLGVGGLWAHAAGWVRADVTLRVDLGLRLHRTTALYLGASTSVERLGFAAHVGVTLYPIRHGLYLRPVLDVLFEGAGVGPGLSLAVGYVFRPIRRLGLFIEALGGGRVTAPYTVQITGWFGLFYVF